MSKFKKMTFLKVLTTIAWADGEVSQSEINIFKTFYRKFDLEKHELDELKPYLLSPIAKKEKDELYRQMIAELSSPEEKKEIMGALETMVEAHKRMKSEERELVNQFSEWLGKTSHTKRSFGRIKNLLQRTIFKHARDMNPDMEKYFKRRVLNKIELKSARSKTFTNLPEERLYFICLVGTLMAAVAHVDDHFDATEKKALKRCLTDQFSLEGKELALLFEVVEEQARQGFDFYEVTAELNRVTSYNDRIHLMECLFEVSIADGKMAHEEAEEIRRISKALRIPHKTFIECKVRALDKIR
ncbi:MAG: TerB family tellurite resistance protein [Nitrospinae bacterium]|nr:TerB family tellurite resistance protein [Nitrospinota bacterium]MBL7018930.1 TerB family tellurite resistance protein [Nitrospinaceae bacterium]